MFDGDFESNRIFNGLNHPDIRINIFHVSPFGTFGKNSSAISLMETTWK